MLRFAAVLIIFVFGVGAAIRSRFAAFLFYQWFALFRPQEWSWIDINSLRLSLVLGLLLVVPSILSGILPNFSHPLSIGAWLLLLSGFVSQIDAVNASVGWFWLDYFARLILVSLLGVTLINSKRRVVVTIAVVAASFGYHSAKYGLGFLLAGGSARYYVGTGGSFGDNNDFALGTAMILPLLVASYQNLSMTSPQLTKYARWGFLAAVPLSMCGIVSTFSRGGFLALSASMLVFLLLQRRRVLYVTSAAIVLGIALVALPVPQDYVERLQTIGTYEEVEDTSALGRIHFWRTAVQMALDRPFGVGLKNFEVAYDAYDTSNGLYGVRKSVHSAHFQVLAELGFGALVIYTAMLVYALVCCLRIRRRAAHESLSAEDRAFLVTTANAFVASMVAFLVGGSFLAFALNDITWLTIGMIAALDRVSRQMVAEGQPAPVAVDTNPRRGPFGMVHVPTPAHARDRRLSAPASR